jgi:cellulose synthase (UDP-forming)
MISKIREIRGKFLLYITIWFGFVSLLFYLSWWFTPERLTSPVLLLAFICILAYVLVQLAFNWILYLAANQHKPYKPKQVDQGFTVDIFVTAYDEEISLIHRCLTAVLNMSGDHRTWLLDDAARPDLQSLALSLGTGYLTRKKNVHHKAGNINSALQKTTGDIIVIFDIDHVPSKNFLQNTLGYFNDSNIGFVQVMLTFAHKYDNATSKAASESSLDFYNPASLGADALGSATLIGSNAIIRRSSLESIGGYQPGLAEDLATSVALHAFGWDSVYVNQPLAPGLAPPDLKAWFDQQFKWSRGVFELLVTNYFKYWTKLTAGQRLSYTVRMTYYWIGLMILGHLLATILILLFGDEQAINSFQKYLLHLLPMIIATIAIRSIALRYHVVSSVKKTLNTPVYMQWKPLLLVAGTWPAYSLSWLLALLRIPIRFRPTPKEAADRGPNLIWILPQMVVAIILFLGLINKARYFQPLQHWPVIGFSVFLIFSQMWVIILALKEVISKKESSFKNQDNKSIIEDLL